MFRVRVDQPIVDEETHISHCARCHDVNCSFVPCPLETCRHCRMVAHQCKISDHSLICTKAEVACVNALYGCTHRVRRDLLYQHLKTCPAYNVVCGRERARCCLGKESKKKLKGIGKRREEKEWKCPPTHEYLPVDLAVARFEQDAILDYYTYSRQDRVRRRDRLHFKEPCLPMRQIIEGVDRLQVPANGQDEEIDSSEDERKIEEGKKNKQKAMFANCYMCQVEPATQHFHTLGREDARWEQLLWKMRRKFYGKEVEPFFEQARLMLCLHADFIPELTRHSENIYMIKKGLTMYSRRCLAIVPRSSFDQHDTSQHSEGEGAIDSLVVRCPLWPQGCTFITSRLVPKRGEIKFITELGAFSYRPHSFPSDPSSSKGLTDLPPWALQEIGRYLSGVNLSSLSMTSTTMREKLVFATMERMTVNVRWKKKAIGSWEENGFYWTFPVTERQPTWEHKICTGDMAAHARECQFRELCPLPDFATAERPGHLLVAPSTLLAQVLPEPLFSTVNELTSANCLLDALSPAILC